MTVDADGNEFTCQAGRSATFGGRWMLPCHVPFSQHKHTLVTAVLELVFCDGHMQELIDAGLISDPYVSKEGADHLAEQERRELVSRPLFGPWNANG